MRRTSLEMGGPGSGGFQSPKRRLTNETPSLNASRIPEFGQTITLKWGAGDAGPPPTTLSRTDAGCSITTGAVGVPVVTTWRPMPRGRGVREHFLCPKCGAPRDVLYWIEGTWACR